MNGYISPVLGVISDELYNSVVNLKLSGYDVFVSSLKGLWRLGVLRSGILFVETEFDMPVTVKGSDLVDRLMSYGFSRSNAVNITRSFSANNRLVRRLLEIGFSVGDVVYGLDLRGRLDELGFVSVSVTTEYALEYRFTVYPIIEVPVPPPPPPPEEILWHPFLAGLLIACETWVEKRKMTVKRAIEARGRFEARKELVMPVLQIRDAVITILEKYVREIEAYGDRNYDILLDECGSVSMELIGIDLLTEQPDELVYIDEEYLKEITISLELYDVNYRKIRDTRTMKVTGRWWEEYE